MNEPFECPAFIIQSLSSSIVCRISEQHEEATSLERVDVAQSLGKFPAYTAFSSSPTRYKCYADDQELL